jgi:Uma2 family endonuclease
MAVQERLYTAADLTILPDDGRRYELDRGRLIIMPPPKREHGLVVLEIAALVRNHVRANDLGEVVAEIGCLLTENPDTVRAPDVSVTAKARVTPVVDDYDRVPPDLAIEVASPGNTTSDMIEKIEQFFEAGVRQVWVFYPRRRVVYVYTSPDTVSILRDEAVLDGGDVLPGLAVRVRDVFAVLGNQER